MHLIGKVLKTMYDSFYLDCESNYCNVLFVFFFHFEGPESSKHLQLPNFMQLPCQQASHSALCILEAKDGKHLTSLIESPVDFETLVFPVKDAYILIIQKVSQITQVDARTHPHLLHQGKMVITGKNFYFYFYFFSLLFNRSKIEFAKINQIQFDNYTNEIHHCSCTISVVLGWVKLRARLQFLL